MPDGRERLPESKTEERGPLAKVIDLAPLFNLIVRVLELLLKIFRII
jgi:hypothetical protein